MSQQCRVAFNQLKKALSQAPVLMFLNPSNFYCDVCVKGVGAILSQEIGGHKHVVAYFRCKLSKAEKRATCNSEEWTTSTKFTIRSDKQLFIC